MSSKRSSRLERLRNESSMRHQHRYQQQQQQQQQQRITNTYSNGSAPLSMVSSSTASSSTNNHYIHNSEILCPSRIPARNLEEGLSGHSGGGHSYSNYRNRGNVTNAAHSNSHHDEIYSESTTTTTTSYKMNNENSRGVINGEVGAGSTVYYLSTDARSPSPQTHINNYHHEITTPTDSHSLASTASLGIGSRNTARRRNSYDDSNSLASNTFGSETGTYYSDDDELMKSSIREAMLGNSYADKALNEGRMNGMQRVRYQQEREQMRRKEEMARLRGKREQDAKVTIHNPFVPENEAEEDYRNYAVTENQNPEDELQKKLKSIGNSPLAKTAAGISAVALVGLAVGPVGFVLGAAAVGAGIGVMHLPEEKRNEMHERATHILIDANEQARILNETVSTSCVQVCEQAGMSKAAEKYSTHVNCDKKNELDIDVTESEMNLDADDNKITGRHIHDPEPGPMDDDRQSMMMPRVNCNRRVACFRRGRIVPVSQIHSLNPSMQPKAWLDVMASILTTRLEKNEAMEEILILAKDKHHARMMLEEGILDSLMWILSGFFKKYSALLRLTDDYSTATAYAHENNDSGLRIGQNAPIQGKDNYVHARLAANCCVTLGKAHCAIVHTEGDLLLMSAYNRGSVPIERQLAQMLFEVPHHTRVVNANMDAPQTGNQIEGDEFFTLKELTMQESENLAVLIKTVCDGKMDKQFGYNQIESVADL